MWHILVRLVYNLWMSGCEGVAPSMWHISGDMRELRHLCGHSQPDFGEWVGVAPSMSQKGSLMLRKKTSGGKQRRRWQKISHF